MGRSADAMVIGVSAMRQLTYVCGGRLEGRTSSGASQRTRVRLRTGPENRVGILLCEYNLFTAAVNQGRGQADGRRGGRGGRILPPYSTGIYFNEPPPRRSLLRYNVADGSIVEIDRCRCSCCYDSLFVSLLGNIPKLLGEREEGYQIQWDVSSSHPF